MHAFEFFNVEACHFENATWSSTVRELDRMTVEPATADKPANFGCIKTAFWFEGQFADRNRLNVPGPFYGAETDTCEAGPGEAPENVLLDSSGQEYVFKQPGNSAEVKAIVLAAACDPFQGYGADGNDHWDLLLIREWWANRAPVHGWIARQLKDLNAVRSRDERLSQHIARLNAFRHFLEERAEAYLRAYAFFLAEKRSPQSGDVLPEVG